jgi:uncharacterized membrane protein YccF (DUF307 family)
MTPLRLILNVLWLFFGGAASALGWFIAGAILAITLIGLPWAFAAWRIAVYTLWPFGREVVWRDRATGEEDIGTGAVGVVMNVVWFLVAGWWLALLHVMVAIVEFVTIVGIPFALKDLELAKLAMAPVGRTIRDKP